MEEAMAKKKRAVLCWARRHGKDLACWNYLIWEALGKKGTYFYIFPEYAQARKALWDAITEDGLNYLDFIPKEVIKKRLNHEMKVYLHNGSIIQVVGSDNYDAIRGTNPTGVVLSEYAYQNPNVWKLVLDPILSKNKGWAIFNSTPNGKNHFYDLYNYASGNSNEWFVSKITNEDTNYVSKEELDKKITGGISEELIAQEYYCSFDIGVQGSYYGKYIRQMQKDSRIGRVSYDDNLLVYTAWDLGFSDSMSIIFYQKRGSEILIIDCYENQGYQLSHYIQLIKSKEYAYGKHFIPHDGKMHNNTGTNFVEVARGMGIEMTVLPQDRNILTGIERVRGLLPRVCIDEKKCDYLIRCLLEYHADFNEKDHVYRTAPKHNWASHMCFVKDTLILTRNGIRPIIEIKDGDEVWTKEGWKKSSNVTKTGVNAQLVEITFEDNTIVRCTPDHMFLTDKGWKYAKDLQKHSVLQSSLTRLLNILMVVYIAYIQKNNIMLGEAKNYTERFGEWLLERFPNIAIFIIEMEIKQITPLQIFNALMHQNMQDQLTIDIRENFQKMLDKKQLNGTHQIKDDYGIKDMLSVLKAGLNGKEKKGIAYLVEKSLMPSLERMAISTNTVMPIVKQLHIEDVKKIDHKEDVYCINVPIEKSFSLSNGAIVHNCDALRYLSASLERMDDSHMPVEEYRAMRQKHSGFKDKSIDSFMRPGWN